MENKYSSVSQDHCCKSTPRWKQKEDPAAVNILMFIHHNTRVSWCLFTGRCGTGAGGRTGKGKRDENFPALSFQLSERFFNWNDGADG